MVECNLAVGRADSKHKRSKSYESFQHHLGARVDRSGGDAAADRQLLAYGGTTNERAVQEV